MTDLQKIGGNAQVAAHKLSLLDTATKNEILLRMADELEAQSETILAANHVDMVQAKQNNIREMMLDRLLLTEERIKTMADGIRQVVQLPDPIGEVDKMWRNADNLLIGQQRVPLGVLGIIYEARPNVTTDAASLAIKSGNAVILRGGKEALHSNSTLVKVLQEALITLNQPADAVQFIDDPSHDVAAEFMQLTDYLDVLIPRGGANLIQRVKKTATVPVIETGTGNNHIYVDKDAQLDMAVAIVENAKVQRPSVCNAVETVLVHTDIAASFLPQLEAQLTKNHVDLHADQRALVHFKCATLATDSDWETEYLDYVLAVKVVDSIEEAIQHINKYNTKHSEAIITDNYSNSQKFLREVDAAAVYINASTRFTDGYVFGFGAEIGISTQKLHARGPMGLFALTSTKYIIYGEGQIRK